MRINEIFYSLQGEGRYAGTPAVFLRLSGCNLHCSYCDTRHQEFSEMTEAEIVEQVKQYPARNIVITGGEPTLQLTASLLRALHTEGFFIHLETNGLLPLPEGEAVDWITCSPKAYGGLRIQRIDELKVVYWGQDISLCEKMAAKDYRLQPLDSGDEALNREITQKTVDYILKHPKWKLSLQTHKILNVR